jgi:DNA-binding MarR family transcriptional regulator
MEFCKSVKERIIISIDSPTFLTKIAKELDITFSHATKSMRDLKGDGIIRESKEVKNNRTKLLELTDKGKKIKDLLIKLKSVE